MILPPPPRHTPPASSPTVCFTAALLASLLYPPMTARFWLPALGLPVASTQNARTHMSAEMSYHFKTCSMSPSKWGVSDHTSERCPHPMGCTFSLVYSMYYFLNTLKFTSLYIFFRLTISSYCNVSSTIIRSVVFYSLAYSQCLELWTVHSRCLINIC